MGPEMVLLATAGSSFMRGVAGAAQANAEEERERINAYIGKTRAIQTGNAMRTDLEGEVASMRSVLAANGQGMDPSSFDLIQRVRDIRSGERRIAVANEMQGVDDHRLAAANARQAAFGSMLNGFFGAMPSLFDYAQMR